MFQRANFHTAKSLRPRGMSLGNRDLASLPRPKADVNSGLDQISTILFFISEQVALYC
jgi:hypothetical protein